VGPVKPRSVVHRSRGRFRRSVHGILFASVLAMIASQVAPELASASGTWGRAIEVPGLSTLNAYANASVSSVSCSSAGNCSAVGSYQPSSGVTQAFVANEVEGNWKTAVEAPGTGAFNTGNGAFLDTVSCKAAGACSAGGFYTIPGLTYRPMVESEVSGTWQSAKRIFGTTDFNNATYGTVAVLSCASVGNCSAGGEYGDRPNYNHVYLIDEVNGHWGLAAELPGTTSLNAAGNDNVAAISCPTPGNCTAGGEFATSLTRSTAFLVNEVRGSWKDEVPVPGVAALATQGNATVGSVSCPTAGNCAAVGTYNSGLTRRGAFVVSEVDGRWGRARDIPGTQALSKGDVVQAGDISCPSVGNCAAGGSYSANDHKFQAFVANEVHGAWSNASEVPGSATLNTGGYASLGPISCPSVGNCGAGGGYRTGTLDYQAFVIDEVHGKWESAEAIPGFVSLDPGGDGGVYSISCPARGSCAAAGAYSLKSPITQAFVVNERNS
jgi:hypothetical protein